MTRSVNRHHVATVAIAATTIAMGLAGGAYSLEARSVVAIATWAAVLLLVALSLVPRSRVPRPGIGIGALLAAFAVLTGLSVLWAPSPEAAFREFDRVSLYLGLFTLVSLVTRPGDARAWVHGLGCGLAVIGVLAFAQRCFPGLFPAQELARYIPNAANRLSYPVGYWNGLAMLAALAFPLLLAAAMGSARAARRGAALAPLPILAGTIYLTSSRGGVAVLVVGLVAFVVLTSHRVGAVIAIALAGGGAALVVSAIAARSDLVAPVAAGDARAVAIIAVAVAVAVGAVWGLVSRRVCALRPSPTLGRVAAALSLLAVVAGVIAADPLQRLRTFKAPPQELADVASFNQAHLLSGGGSGRWQFWETAASQFTSYPLFGDGAGSYAAWWNQHGSFAYSLRNAHSLYLETLGELGLVGFVLLAGALLLGLAVGLSRLRRGSAEQRLSIAALSAVMAAFLVGAAIDWIWQLTVAGAVGIVCLSLLAGPATAPRVGAVRAPGPPAWQRLARSRSLGATAATVIAAWLLICAQAIPWLAQREVLASQAAERAGDAPRALAKAQAARTIQPWAASPYLQLALVAEQANDLPAARKWIRTAISKNSTDWTLWLVSARIDTRVGALGSARAALARARSLNPRSPLFTQITSTK